VAFSYLVSDYDHINKLKSNLIRINYCYWLLDAYS